LQNVNYAGLRTLLHRYGAHGLQLLAFPSNDFAQAPCSSDCERAYIYHKMNVSTGAFPVFDKVHLHGPGTAEIYTILQRGGGPGKLVTWNYAKFLVGANGTFVASYAPEADPLTAEADVRRELGLSPQLTNERSELDERRDERDAQQRLA
jgi:glutathione peroxidase